MRGADNFTTFLCRMSLYLGASTSWNPQGLSGPVMGLICYHHTHRDGAVIAQSVDIDTFMTKVNPVCLHFWGGGATKLTNYWIFARVHRIGLQYPAYSLLTDKIHIILPVIRFVIPVVFIINQIAVYVLSNTTIRR